MRFDRAPSTSCTPRTRPTRTRHACPCPEPPQPLTSAAQYHVTYDIRKFADDFSHLKNGESDTSKAIQLAGRIYVKRSAGSKLYFYDIRSDVRAALHLARPRVWKR